jgi:hypothetical protein
MIPPEKQDTLEFPGVSLQIRGFSGPLGELTRTITTGTCCANFDDVKPILSAKPLHRPNRIKPRDL